MHLWNVAGAFIRLKGIVVNAYLPHGEQNAVLSSLSSSEGTW